MKRPIFKRPQRYLSPPKKANFYRTFSPDAGSLPEVTGAVQMAMRKLEFGSQQSPSSTLKVRVPRVVTWHSSLRTTLSNLVTFDLDDRHRCSICSGVSVCSTRATLKPFSMSADENLPNARSGKPQWAAFPCRHQTNNSLNLK